MDKNIIVTGGAQGIGRIVSEQLVKNGYKVSVFEKDEEAINEFKNEINSATIAFFHTDVSDENEVKVSVAAAFEKFGNIGGLVNNAGIEANGPMTELSLDDWNRVIGTNLTGAFLCSKHAASHLKKSNGSIINISSTRAFNRNRIRKPILQVREEYLRLPMPWL